MKIFLHFLIVFAVTGCKVEVEIPLRLSQLETGKPYDITVNMEVASCNSFEDSRKPSDSLEKLLKEVEANLPEMKFKECFSKKVESFASFTIEGKNIFSGDWEKHNTETNIQFLSGIDKESEDIVVDLLISESLKKKIRDIEKVNMIPYTKKVKIDVINDTNKPLTISTSGVYAYDFPVPYSLNLDTGPKETIVNLVLSDVSTDFLFFNNESETPLVALLTIKKNQQKQND